MAWRLGFAPNSFKYLHSGKQWSVSMRHFHHRYNCCTASTHTPVTDRSMLPSLLESLPDSSRCNSLTINFFLFFLPFRSLSTRLGWPTLLEHIPELASFRLDNSVHSSIDGFRAPNEPHSLPTARILPAFLRLPCFPFLLGLGILGSGNGDTSYAPGPGTSAARNIRHST